MSKRIRLCMKSLMATLIIALIVKPSLAQTTAFTYQGKLTTSGTPATGTYDLEFRLFDALTAGAQQGGTLTLTNVAVDSGIFTVQLDFGACESCINGAPRFLEIAVRPTGGGSFTTLLPRQQISSTPYAIKTKYLTFNGGFDDGTTPFTASNVFAGDGAGVNTTPDPLPNNPGGKFNAFYGAGAGIANTTGSSNSFFGKQAGFMNNVGLNNSFFGARAGLNTTTGFANSFLGGGAGANNTTGVRNTFIGAGANFNIVDPTGNDNTLLGQFSRVISGVFNGTAIGGRAQVAQSNSLVLGAINGVNGATADTNVGIGTSTPTERLDVVGNAIVSGNVGIGTTAPEAKLQVSGGSLLLDNSQGLFLKSSANVQKRGVFADSGDVLRVGGAGSSGFDQMSFDLATAGTVMTMLASGDVGIGTTSPAARLHISGVGVVRARVESDVNARYELRLANQPKWSMMTAFAGGFQIFNDASNAAALSIDPVTNNVGIGSDAPTDKLEVGGILRVFSLGSAGSTSICRNALSQISTCSSSLRYKTNLAALQTGLRVINQLHPLTFDWKQGGEHDLGLVAEDVAKVEPMLVTHNEKGEIEGVKYDRINVILINAIKEQQQQINQQTSKIQSQQREINTLKQRQLEFDSLKALVCADHPTATVCRSH